MNDYTSTDYVNAFRHLNLQPYQRRMLEIHYCAPNHTLTATQMAKAMGFRNWGGANLHYGVLGKLVAEMLGWHPMPETKLYVLAEFEKPGREWHWIMRSPVASAMEILGWAKTEQSRIPEEVEVTTSIHEGAIREIRVNAYERSSVAREQCILHHGCKCAACGIVLADVYGESAQGYIHVHHLRQLSEIGESYQVNPISDLLVCPNCHAIIHMRKPPYSIQEIENLIHAQKENANNVLHADASAASVNAGVRDSQ